MRLLFPVVMVVTSVASAVVALLVPALLFDVLRLIFNPRGARA